MKPAPGRAINPRIRLQRLLSEGAMGSVWVADHLTLETEVAVKFISADLTEDPAILERFQREAKAAARIKSPNVVQMLDHGVTDEGLPYIVMELMEGQTLDELLSEVKTLGLTETAAVVSQVARALAKAHSLGIIHRDIKPANIFLLAEEPETTGMEEQHVKVLDFGIAKHVEIPEGITVPGMVIGTPGYMCPDQVLHAKEVGPEADIWSLAVVAYHCITGELPFFGDTLAKLVGALVRAEFTKPSELRADIPEAVDRFFERAFQKDTAARFQSAVELANAFREAVDPAAVASQPQRDSSPVTVEEPPASSDSTPRSVEMDAARATLTSLREVAAKPNRLKGVVIAALGIAIGVGVVVAVNSGAKDSPAPTPSASAAWQRGSSSARAIPAGSFQLGCDQAVGDCPKGSLPSETVTLDAFRIDRTEVTVAAYRDCVNEEACSVAGLTEDPVACNWGQAGRERHPVNCVSLEQAETYCRWAGGRLPSDAEWERAARGSEDRPYPWGDEPAGCNLAIMRAEDGPGCGRGGTWQVGSRPNAISPSGALDMGGNLREWVDARQASEDAGSMGVVRGGGYLSDAPSLRTTARDLVELEERAVDIGFRCVRGVGG